MRFTYRGVDRTGKALADSIEAVNMLDASEKLRKQGLFITDIRGADEEIGGGQGPRRLGAGKRLKHLAMFSRQLHVLVSTGTPLVQALMALERQAKDAAWKEVVVGLRTKVEEGATLSGAMSSYPLYFDSVARSLIAAGESAGNFDIMLDRLATLIRKQLHVRSSIIGALVYPALLIVVAVAVLVLMLTFVLPRFGDLFKTLDTALPPTTQFLMFLSMLLRSYWWAMIGAAAGGFVSLKMWLASAHGKRALDTVLVSLPQMGRITRNFCTARVTRLLGTLVESKVPLLEAIQLTRGGTPNSHYQNLLLAAEAAVTRGEPISAAFADARLIDPSVCEAIRNGERSGQVGPLLLNMSDFLDEDNEVVVRSLTSILEPVILIVLGLLVGFVAISMFLPLFDLTSATGGG